MNEAFRATVTDVAFHLSLSRAMCCGLVGLAEAIRENRFSTPEAQGPWARPFANWATTAGALKRRGLIDHHFDEDHSMKQAMIDGGKDAMWDPDRVGVRWHYSLTRAGELTCELLKEAGIYQDIVPGLVWWQPRVA